MAAAVWLTLLFCGFLPAVAFASCPPSWAAYGSACYAYTTNQWDFVTARSTCLQRGGDLVSFENVAEREFIFSLIKQTKETFWIGATRASPSDPWIWTDGRTPGPNDDSIKNWADKCPDNCDGDCVQMAQSDGKWTNVPTSWKARGVCKRGNDVVDPCDFDNGWHSFNTSCYKYSSIKRSWLDAQQQCMDGNGNLVVANTQAKWSLLQEFMPCKDFDAGVWIGLSDTDTTTEYRWVDGSSLGQPNWDTDQPKNISNNGNNCVASLPVANFKWRADTCDTANDYLCEKPQGTCPEGWIDKGTGFCYFVVGEAAVHRRSWSDAEALCQSYGAGGHLMSVNNIDQQNALNDLAGLMIDVSKIRIGLSDTIQDNVFRWSDGNTITYSNPGTQERVNRRVDCGYIDTIDPTAKWNTGYCYDHHAFICQLPIHSILKTPPEQGGWLCDDGWEADQLNGWCYKFVDTAFTYADAKSGCSGSKFLTILSAAEQSFIATRLHGRTWLGLEYRGSGSYQWYDNSQLRFENWRENGLNTGASTSCTVLRETDPAGEWMDEDCSVLRYSICKAPSTHSTATTPSPTPTAPWNSQCGPTWSYDVYGQACYKLVSEQLTWEDAQLACKSLGANLVSIHGSHEQNYINALVMQNIGYINFWIGGNDINQNYGWRWSDGSPFYFWNWNDGEPNNKGGTEFCVEMSADMLGRWNDIDCDRKFSYICSKPATTATLPPSAEPSPPPMTCDNPAALISGRHYVRDVALTSSSAVVGREAPNSRIFEMSASSWTPATSDTSAWVGVLFSHYVIVSGFTTTGDPLKDEWVKTYQVSYRLQTGSFYEFYRLANGNIATFDGNTDRTTYKTNTLSPSLIILAHGIRLHPMSFNTAPSMRFELLGCKWDTCQSQPLITGEAMVPDSRMTASGQWDEFHAPSRGRINSAKIEDEAYPYRGGWVANTPWTANQWIQVEFDTAMAIYAVQTKGRQDYPQYTNSYKLQYAEISGAPFETYQEPYGVDKIFDGNNDQDTLVTNYLAANIYNVKFVRINPQTWTAGVALRFEILGCGSHREGCSDIPLITGVNNYIPNSRLTASSSLSDTDTGPARSRLNQRANGNLAGAWVPNADNANQWIQADMGRTSLVMAVATQGRQDKTMYVTSYKLSYSQDGTAFTDYLENGTLMIFEANYDQHAIHKYYLAGSLSGRYLRLHPVTWNVSIALRWEIYACAGWTTPSIIGCFGDKSDNRDLIGRNITMTPEGMTHAACVDFCRTQQYLYAGVQMGEACYCGNSYGRHGPSDSCDIPCRGDPSKQTMCGGTSSNTVLHTGIFSPDQVIGCYGDNPDRDLPYEHYMGIGGGSTQAYCAMHCFNKGYRYAGAQFSYECYCGNTYGRYGPSSMCNSFCAGDRTNQTICGGAWANTVMSTGIAEDHPRCRDGWTPFGVHCYKVFNESVTWMTAKTTCMLMGGELATVNYPVINDFLSSKATEFNTRVWVGMHCKRMNNYFEWVSGDPVLFTNWNRREPNNARFDENCVEMYTNGKWNDNPCDDTGIMHGYACRMDKEEIVGGSTPAPDDTCPQGWSAYRWKCFQATKTLAWDWPQSKAQCETFGGNLVRIEDGAEQAFLSSTFGLTPGSYWTDLTESDGQFKFSNGDSPSYVNWGSEEPFYVGGSGCVVVNMTEHGLWHNRKCDELHVSMSVCEFARTGYTKPTVKPTLPATGDCAPGWIMSADNRNCFLVSAQISNMRRTWTDALAVCRDMGADLVSIHSQAENDQLRIYTTDKAGDFWIGLNARDNSAGFVWSDDTPMDFEFFSGPGLKQASGEVLEPANQADGLDCVDFYASTASWNKIACDSKRNWICKIARGISVAVTTTTPGPSAGPPGSCSPDNDDWKFFNERCYYFTGRSMNEIIPNVPETSEFSWWDAEDRCRVLGGTLASIHTMEEQKFIEGMIRLYNTEALNMWIGLNDLNPPGSWKWTDGTPTDFIHWGEGQPDDPLGMELCAAMEINAEAFGTWNDRHCQQTRPFICTKRQGGPPITTPEPSPMPGFCPSGYLTYGNKCFKFYDDKVNWNAAVDKCLAAGARPYSLATISDPWEQAFLTSQSRSRYNSDYTRYWIGLHQYRGNNGEFGWVDNSRPTFTNWAPGEPNGGESEGCVQIYVEPFRAGLWNDESCGLEIGYICQRMRDPSLDTNPDPPVNTCPSGYSQWSGNCYKVDSTSRSWQAAEDECARNDGGHLANVIDRAEQGYLTTLMREAQVDLWIGLSDKSNVGRYIWSDGTTVRHTSWGSGMPSILTGGCVHLGYSMNGDWMDKQCSSTYGSICKLTRTDTIVTPPAGSGHCTSSSSGDNWVEFGTHCYLFRPLDYVTMPVANQRCVLEEGQLASVHSDEGNDFIQQHVVTSTPQTQWIGLLKTQQGSFMWTDLSSVGYYNWEVGEPNDHNRTNNEDCTELYIWSGKWNDIRCDKLNGYICRKRQDFGTGPTPIATSPPTVTLSSSGPSTQSTPTTTSTAPLPGTTPASTVIVSLPPGSPPSASSKQLSSGGVVGVVMGCLILAMIATFAGLIYLKSRGSLSKFDSAGFDNPGYKPSRSVQQTA